MYYIRYIYVRIGVDLFIIVAYTLHCAVYKGGIHDKTYKNNTAVKKRERNGQDEGHSKFYC